jgi:hypothetical protein
VAAKEKRIFDKGIEELACMSDNDDDFWGDSGAKHAVNSVGEEVGEEEEDEGLDELLGRVLSA